MAWGGAVDGVRCECEHRRPGGALWMERGVRCECGHRRPGGAVDGGEVNDTHMFQGAERPRTCECGDAICQQGLHLLRVRHLLSLNMERESCGVPTQTEGGHGVRTQRA